MPEIHIIDATRELGIIRFMKDYKPPFEVLGNYRLIDDGERPEATVLLRTGEQEMHEADVGVGPVDALANVLKKSLGRLFPDLPNVRLLDFEVHLIQGTIGTSASVEVHIVFSDGKYAWKVSSSSDNINLASFRALLDGYEYAIYLGNRDKAQRKVQSPESRVQRKSKVQSTKSTTQGKSRKVRA
jgi:2-isopropylmalate synthase